MTTAREVTYCLKLGLGHWKPTSDLKHWSGLPESCPLCGTTSEDIKHVLLYCFVLGPPPAALLEKSPAFLLGLDGAHALMDSTHLRDVKAQLVLWWNFEGIHTCLPIGSLVEPFIGRVCHV